MYNRKPDRWMDAWMRSDLSDGWKGLNRYSSTNKTSEIQTQPTYCHGLSAHYSRLYRLQAIFRTYVELPSTPSQYLFLLFTSLLFACFWCFFPLVSWEDTSVGGDAYDGVKSTMSRNKPVAEAAQSYGLEKENKSQGRSEAKVGDQTSERKRAGLSVSWRGVGLLVFHLSA